MPHKKKTAEKTQTKTRARMSAEDFVAIWQSAKSIDEIAEATGTSPPAVRGRAARLRRVGVPLKKFPSGHRRFDVAALKALAEKLAPKKE